jgi:hypothetical protein
LILPPTVRLVSRRRFPVAEEDRETPALSGPWCSPHVDTDVMLRVPTSNVAGRARRRGDTIRRGSSAKLTSPPIAGKDLRPADPLVGDSVPFIAAATASARQSLVFNGQRIRGASILAVIAMHANPARPVGMPITELDILLTLLRSLVRFGVPIFVLLSGFHLSLNPRNERPASLYRRTLPLILIPYLGYSAVYLLVRLLLITDVQTIWAGFPTVLIRVWLWHLAHASADLTPWFIPAIFGLYVLHPFLHAWYRRVDHQARFVALALVFQFACALLHTWFLQPAMALHDVIWAGFVWLRCLTLVGFFVLGYCVHDHAGAIMKVLGR